jgi:hypothetical protein
MYITCHLTLHCCPAVKLNANRQVTGILRGFDQFMNIVLDQTVDDRMKQDIGMVVGHAPLSYSLACVQ